MNARPVRTAMTAAKDRLPSLYQIGDVVWWLHTWDVADRQPCPTCKGEGRVRLEGLDRYVTCPDASIGAHPRERCSNGTVPGDGTQTRCYIEYRTIGQVRITATLDEPVKVEYMAHETGIGSGSLLPEEKLFPTFEAAQAAARGALRMPYGTPS